MADREPQELTLDIAIKNIGAFFTRIGEEGKLEPIAPFAFDGLRTCWNFVVDAVMPEPEAPAETKPDALEIIRDADAKAKGA